MAQQPELKLSAILLFSSSLIAFVACERLELLKTEICVAVVAIRKLLVNFLGSFCMFLFLSVSYGMQGRRRWGGACAPPPKFWDMT